MPDFIALLDGRRRRETVDVAKTIAQVLWDDLNFEREFALHPARHLRHDSRGHLVRRRAVRSLARAERRRRHRRHGAEDRDRRPGRGAAVQRARRARRRSAASTRRGREQPRSSRTRSPTRSTSSSAALRGVARTKLTFDSDRDGERMTGTVENRGVKEIYIADYDGENQRRVTVEPIAEHHADAGRPTAARSPTRRTAAAPPNIFISNIYQGTLDEADQGRQGENLLPAWSPDGTRIAFTSTRDGNSGDLRREPRRLEPAAADEQSRHRHHADLVAVGHADRVHVGSHRHAADLHRRRRRPRPARS